MIAANSKEEPSVEWIDNRTGKAGDRVISISKTGNFFYCITITRKGVRCFRGDFMGDADEGAKKTAEDLLQIKWKTKQYGEKELHFAFFYRQQAGVIYQEEEDGKNIYKASVPGLEGKFDSLSEAKEKMEELLRSSR